MLIMALSGAVGSVSALAFFLYPDHQHCFFIIPISLAGGHHRVELPADERGLAEEDSRRTTEACSPQPTADQEYRLHDRLPNISSTCIMIN